MSRDDQWSALVKDLWAAYIRMYGFPADGPNVKHAPEWRELWERTEALANEQPIVRHHISVSLEATTGAFQQDMADAAKRIERAHEHPRARKAERARG